MFYFPVIYKCSESQNYSYYLLFLETKYILLLFHAIAFYFDNNIFM